MQTAVALLGLLLASAQAFHVPLPARNPHASKASFFGSGIARQASLSPYRARQLRASLEDIERRLAEQERKAKDEADKAKSVAAVKGSKTKPSPAPTKAVAPAPVPRPAPAPAPALKAPLDGEPCLVILPRYEIWARMCLKGSFPRNLARIHRIKLGNAPTLVWSP